MTTIAVVSKVLTLSLNDGKACWVLKCTRCAVHACTFANGSCRGSQLLSEYYEELEEWSRYRST